MARRETTNIIGYIRRYGDRDFWQMPFNEVDSLVLSTLVYADLSITPFGKIESFNCTVAELGRLVDTQKLAHLIWNVVRREELLKAVAKSRRFGDLRMKYYVNDINDKKQKQLVAVTFELDTPDGMVNYLAFQGTDDTLAGWKEDFNMSYSRSVPAQRSALDYLKYVAHRDKNSLILGGHSKGGNLATYAALKASALIKRRIVAVYDHDGPGFLPGTFHKWDIEMMKKKVHKTTPQTAFVGLLMENPVANPKVVASDGLSIWQHDPLSWQVKGQHFQRANRNWTSGFLSRSASRWIRSLSAADRRKFIDDCYDIILATGVQTMPEFKHYFRWHLPTLIKMVNTSDPEVRATIIHTFKLLARANWIELWK